MEDHLPVKNKYVYGLCLLTGALAALVIFCNNPTETAWYPKCLFYSVSGYLCCGCGMTRAVYHLLHGDVLRSLQCNILIYLFGLWGVSCMFSRRFVSVKIALSLLAVSLVYTVLRNLNTAFSFALKP